MLLTFSCDWRSFGSIIKWPAAPPFKLLLLLVGLRLPKANSCFGIRGEYKPLMMVCWSLSAEISLSLKLWFCKPPAILMATLVGFVLLA